MWRALFGALCGWCFGTALALPACLIITLVEGDDQRMVVLLHAAFITGGFGGVIGSIIGATGAIVEAIRRGDRELPAD